MEEKFKHYPQMGLIKAHCHVFSQHERWHNMCADTSDTISRAKQTSTRWWFEISHLWTSRSKQMAGLSGLRHVVDNVSQSRGEGMADNPHLTAPSAKSRARTAHADMQSHTGTSCKADGKINQRWVRGTVNCLEFFSPASLQILHCIQTSFTLNWKKRCPDHMFNHIKPRFFANCAELSKAITSEDFSTDFLPWEQSCPLPV